MGNPNSGCSCGHKPHLHDLPLHPPHLPPLHRTSTNPSRIPSNNPVGNTENNCSCQVYELPKVFEILSSIVMSTPSCNDPSLGTGSPVQGYIIEDLSSLPDESAGEAHMPVVHLPANVPPPIALSGTGYPIGIAGPDGSPAWAKPTVPIKPLKHEHGRGHEHRSHRNTCHSNNRHCSAVFQDGPEYLIPLGTPIRNPHGPGIAFIPPEDPRIIPCRPVRDQGQNIDYKGFGTDQGDRLCHHNPKKIHIPRDPQAAECCPVDQEFKDEYARMKLRAEQSERARIEEIERNQALWNARQNEYEERIRHAAMANDKYEHEVGANGSVHPLPVSSKEKVININVRHPCKKCQELVTIGTQVLHHRFSSNPNKGIGINIDSPHPKPDTEVLCEKCKAAEMEEAKNADLLRKVVRQVFTEAASIPNGTNNAKRARDGDLNSGIPSFSSRGAFQSNIQGLSTAPVALEHSLLNHGKKKSSRLENNPEDTRSATTNNFSHCSRARLHVRPKRHIVDTYKSEVKSDGEDAPITSRNARVAHTDSGAKSHNRLSRSVLAALDKNHFLNKENIRSTTSSVDGPEEDYDYDDDDEEEIIVVRRARRHNDKDNSKGNRSHPVLSRSATKNPDESIEAVARRLANNLTVSPPKSHSFHGNTKQHTHIERKHQGKDSGSSSSSESDLPQKQNLSSTRIHTHRRPTHIEIRGPIPTHYRRHHHRREIVTVDDENSSGYHRHPHHNHDAVHHQTAQNAAPGFLSGWSFFGRPGFNSSN
ncbi:hypothetical protein TWF730_008979 [Orbilia blumenaviensis]|uniref:Uncharacterized protein n=1 Tax=Orbilia blumenaviensis TaxID=1796055 RepID=A0AAV9UX15_9PEZI